jgi:hypothetical protein
MLEKLTIAVRVDHTSDDVCVLGMFRTQQASDSVIHEDACDLLNTFEAEQEEFENPLLSMNHRDFAYHEFNAYVNGEDDEQYWCLFAINEFSEVELVGVFHHFHQAVEVKSKVHENSTPIICSAFISKRA